MPKIPRCIAFALHNASCEAWILRRHITEFLVSSSPRACIIKLKQLIPRIFLVDLISCLTLLRRRETQDTRSLHNVVAVPPFVLAGQI